jgi:hypothetical protein
VPEAHGVGMVVGLAVVLCADRAVPSPEQQHSAGCKLC